MKWLRWKHWENYMTPHKIIIWSKTRSQYFEKLLKNLNHTHRNYQRLPRPCSGTKNLNSQQWSLKPSETCLIQTENTTWVLMYKGSRKIFSSLHYETLFFLEYAHIYVCISKYIFTTNYLNTRIFTYFSSMNDI